MTIGTGAATVNGEQTAERVAEIPAIPAQAAPAAPAQPAPDHKPEIPGSVPYARFQEVVEQRKGLESTLNGLIDGMVAELPEDMRDLVPNLPPAEKAAWIRAARERGLFTPGILKNQDTPTNSPDAKRPGAKQPIDYSGLSPLQKMQAGYGQQ